MRRILGLSTVGLLAVVLLAATPPKNLKDVKPKPGPMATKIAAPLDVGTVVYDPGAPADKLLVGVGGPGYNNYVGNLFNSASGNPLSPGTVYAASWYQAKVSSSAYAIIVFGPPVGGVGSGVTAAGVSPFAFNAFSFTPASFGSQFFAGLGFYPGYFGAVGARSATVNGQGFHGQRRGFSGYGGGTTVLNQNVMFRVTGDILIPVELMEFSVE